MGDVEMTPSGRVRGRGTILNLFRFRCAFAKYCPDSPQRIVSLHMPKAAGTSLKAQYVALLGNAVHTDYRHDPLTPAGSENAEFPRGKRVVHGHFRASRYASSQAFFVTFLREPADNLISIYFYWSSFRQPGHDLHARFLRDQPSLLEFATYPGIRRLMSETYFGGFDMSRFDFIGFHDTRNEDLLRLARILNLNFRPWVHKNKTAASPERRQIENDPVLISELRRRLADDIDFYDDARKRAAPN
jgi:Sulfotransferase family